MWIFAKPFVDLTRDAPDDGYSHDELSEDENYEKEIFRLCGLGEGLKDYYFKEPSGERGS